METKAHININNDNPFIAKDLTKQENNLSAALDRASSSTSTSSNSDSQMVEKAIGSGKKFEPYSIRSKKDSDKVAERQEAKQVEVEEKQKEVNNAWEGLV